MYQSVRRRQTVVETALLGNQPDSHRSETQLTPPHWVKIAD